MNRGIRFGISASKSFSFLYIIRFLLTFFLFITLLPTMLPAQPAYAAPVLKITQTADKTVAYTGETITLKLQYRCASTTEDCYNMVVSDALDPNFVYIGAEGNPHIDTIAISGQNPVDGTGGTVTWTFNSTLAAGSTGELVLRIKFKDDGTCEDGTTAPNQATIKATGTGQVPSNIINFTAVADNDNYTVSKVRKSGTFLMYDPDDANPVSANVTYSINVCMPSGTGVVNLDDIEITDTLPAGAEYVSADPAPDTVETTPPPTTVTWSGLDLTVDEGCESVDVEVFFPTSTYTVGETFENTADVSGTPLGGSRIPFPTESHSAEAELPDPQGSMSKSVSPPYMDPGGEVEYSLSPQNTGNITLTNFVVTDTIVSELEVTEIRTRLPANMLSGVTVYWTTNTGTNNGSQTYTLSDTYTLDVDTLGFDGDEQITELRWDYGDVPPDFNASGTGFTATVDPVATPNSTVIDNTGTLSATNLLNEEDDNASLPVRYPMARPNISKSANKGSVNHGDTIQYTLNISNNSFTDTILRNPSVVDTLPPELAYQSFSVNGGSCSLASGSPSVSEDGTWLQWDCTSDIASGSSLEIVVTATVNDTAIATFGSYEPIKNTATLLNWDNPTGNTEYVDLQYVTACSNVDTDGDDVDNDNNTGEATCVSNTNTASVNSTVLMDAELWVKGELDSDWSRYPNVGQTTPGGKITYRLEIENIGSVPVTDLELIDILPFLGDTGVIDVAARYSQWRPQFTELIYVPPGVSVSYSTAENPERTRLIPTGPIGSDPPDWSAVPPDDQTNVQSFRIEFGSQTMNPRDKAEVIWTMQAPTDVPEDLIAWDSFGFVAERTDEGTDLLPAEPIKVGIKVVQPPNRPSYGNYVWIDSDKDGSQEPGESGYNLVRVELYKSSDMVVGNGDDTLVKYTYTADNHAGEPGYYVFNDESMSAGNYYARFYPPVGYEVTTKSGSEGNDDDSDVFWDATNSMYRTEFVTVLDANEEDLTWDMGLAPKNTAAVGNYVWFDRDGDGIQDESPGDGLNGITVELLQGGTTISTTQTTTRDGFPGYYLFDDLTPGTYSLRFTLPSGATFTGQDGGGDDVDSDANTSTGETITFTLNAGDYDDTRDAGIIMPTGDLKLGNIVWFDDNRNSIQDTGEEGVNGVIVNLYTDDGTTSGEYDSNDSYFLSTVTETRAGKKGFYLFEDLPEDDYIVQIAPENFDSDGVLYNYTSSNGAPDPDTDETDADDNGTPDVEPDPTYGVVSYAVTLTTGGEPTDDADDAGLGGNDNDSNMTVDFGFYLLSSVGNYVWLDLDGDGVQDSDESGVNGVTVQLYKSDGTLVDTTTTSNDDSDNPGYYLFEGLIPDDYYVQFVLPATYDNFTLKDGGGDDTADSDAAQISETNPGRTATFTLGVSEYNDTLDAGLLVPTGSYRLGNIVWLDNDNDGIYESGDGETGIDNVVVNLYKDGLLFDTTTTSGGGTYLFEDLPAGDYTVEIDAWNFLSGNPLDGYLSSTGNDVGGEAPDPDTDNDNDDNGDPQGDVTISKEVTIENNVPGIEPDVSDDGDDTDGNLTVDFGFFGTASLGDYVWIDEDWDGEQDGSESGLAAVDVYLYRVNPNGSLGPLVDSTVTDPTGYYRFDDLEPDTYRIEFIEPYGYKITAQDALGGNDDDDSDAAPDGANRGFTHDIDLTLGEEDLSIDVGMYRIVSLGNRVWFDLDNDGVYEPGGDDETNPGINDVTVSLYYDDGSTNGSFDSGDTFITSTLTLSDTNDAPGYYLFEELREDRYIVVFDETNFQAGGELIELYSSTGNGISAPDPDDDETDHDDNGDADTDPSSGNRIVVSKAVDLQSGYEPENEDSDSRTNLTVDFGFYEKVEVGNRVWLDIDNDGVYEPGDGETGINDVDIRLYDGSGSVVRTTTTANDGTYGDGYYLFDELDPGTYTVEIVASNFTSSGTLYGYATSTGNGNDNNPTENAPSVADHSDPDYNDTDNGNNDDDPTGMDHGRWDNSQNVVSYEVSLGSNSETFVNIETGNLSINRAVDFGFYPTVSLGNFVWQDDDNNGLFDGGETGIANVSLRLYRDNGDGVYGSGDTQVTEDVYGNTFNVSTDTNGYYSFDNLHPGDYIVRIPNNEFTSGDLQGLASSTGNGNTNNPTDNAQDDPDPPTESDTDDNGYWTSTPNRGVVSKAVTLTIDGEPTGETGDSGDDNNHNFTVDFGFFPTLSLGNIVWRDGDNDGVYEPGDGETGIENVRLWLYHDNDTSNDYSPGDTQVTVDMIGTNLSNGVTTNASGVYSFDNLHPGNYIVQVVEDNFYTSGDPLYSLFSSDGNDISGEAPDPDTEPSADNDNDDNGNERIVGSGTWSKAISLTLGTEPNAGFDNPTLDFGFYGLLSLGNRVWLDQDNDGVYEPGDGETGIDGVTVLLYNNDGSTPDKYDGTNTQVTTDGLGNDISSGVTTSGGGYYTFTNLLPGDYLVVIPATNFDNTSDALYEMYTSTGNDVGGEAPGPEDDEDSDDNGYDVGSDVVASKAVTLIDTQEPSPPDDEDGTSGNTTVDFGFYSRVSVGNRVWHDVNNNGTFDSGEVGIDGVTMRLYRDDGTTANEYDSGDTLITTDADGNAFTNDETSGSGYYTFTNLLPGNYIVQVDDNEFGSGGTLEGYYSSSGHETTPGDAPDPDTDPTPNTNNDDNGNEYQSGQGVWSKAVTVYSQDEPDTAADEDDTDGNMTVDFGFHRYLTLGNRVWRDVDNNGTLDSGEVGIDGVTVLLYRDDGDNTYDTGDTLVTTDAVGNDISSGIPTSSGGYYTFTNLLPDNYIVVIDSTMFGAGNPLEGYVSSTHDVPAPNPNNDTDHDDNGEPDTPTGDVASFAVELLDDGNEPTSEDGDNLTNLTVDFGFHKPLSLGNLVWLDSDNDGQYEPGDGEEGISGVEVELYWDRDADGVLEGTDPLSDTVTTDASGLYTFTDLLPGDYFVVVTNDNFTTGVLQNHISSTGGGYDTSIPDTPDDPDDDNEDNDDNGQEYQAGDGVVSKAITLIDNNEPDVPNDEDDTSGNTTVDFGFLRRLSLGNRVWLDQDNNGTLDSGEPGIAGVEVWLYYDDSGTDGIFDGTETRAQDTSGTDLVATTNAGGYYTFTNLLPGDYLVVIPATNFDNTSDALYEMYTSTGNDVGGEAPGPEDDEDSDDNGYDVGSDVVASKAITLLDRQEPDTDADEDDTSGNTTVDFGFYSRVSVGNRVWHDVNNNGTFESATESGIDGVTMRLYEDVNDDGLLDTGDTLVTTDADGNAFTTDETSGSGYYTFTNLLPGNYIVQVDDNEFGSGGTLEGYYSSSGHETTPGDAPDPDTDPTPNTNNDDNGNEYQSGQGVWSKAVTVYSQDEPDTAADEDDTDGNMTVDFGFHKLVSVGNRVWHDVNNNGTFESATESGIDGVTMRLYEDVNDDGLLDTGDTEVTGDAYGNAFTSSTTSGGGYYSFDNLMPGNYIVQIDPTNYATSSDPLYGFSSSTGNGTAPDPDPAPEGEEQDNDDNGDLHTSEPGTYGVVSLAVTLSDGDEPVPNDDEDDNSGNTTVDFGFYRLVSLGNIVWLDLDNDGQYESGDGETGISGVTMLLYQDNGTTPNEYDSSDTPVTEDAYGNTFNVSTNADGYYSFDNLHPDDYIVVIPASNFASSSDPLYGLINSTWNGINGISKDSTDQSPDPDPDPDGTEADSDDNGRATAAPETDGVASYAVTLELDSEPTGEPEEDDADEYDDHHNLTVDFGFYPMLTLGNLVWLDADNSGDVNGGESGIDGIVVNLFLDSNDDGTPDSGWDTPFDTTTATATGFYTFTDLLPGTYIVQVAESNFETSGNLSGLNSSTGNDNASDEPPDPDTEPSNHTDNDDNGYDRQTGQGVWSKPITLVYGDEPDGVHNEINPTVDFGFYGDMALGNLVWHDEDNNGEREPGENGISGVVVNLYIDSNDDGEADDWDNPLQTATTNISGEYRFEGLSPDYYIVQIDPSNFEDGGALEGFSSSTGNGTAPDPDDSNDPDNDDNGDAHDTNPDTYGVVSLPVTLVDNQEPDEEGNTNLRIDFGFYETASVGNYVWLDNNDNGIQDDGNDSGLNGVTVHIYRSSDDTRVDTTTTTDDSDGNPGYYRFDGLEAGVNYYLEFVLPDGFTSFVTPDQGDGSNDSDADENNGQTSSFSLEPRQYDDTWDAGLKTSSTPFLKLGDLVWNDRNQNGIYEPGRGEQGINGVVIRLYQDTDSSDSYTAGDALVSTKTTSNDNDGNPGFYRFDNLAAGTYIIHIVEDNFTSGGKLVNFTNTSGDADPDNDEANDDDNGIPQSGDGVWSTAITLKPGTEPTGDGDTSTNTNLTVDFGFYYVPPPNSGGGGGSGGSGGSGGGGGSKPKPTPQPRPPSGSGTATLGDRVWFDINRNGIQDTNEEGIGNVTVKLYDASTDNLVRTRTTDAEGWYKFTGLKDGQYYIYIEIPVDYTVTTRDSGGNDERDSDIDARGKSHTVTLNEDVTNLTLDAGLYVNLSLGNYVWKDLNNNGIHDEGEPGINGVTVNLFKDKNQNGKIDIDEGVGTTVTADKDGKPGYYLFTNLTPGDYIVQVSQVSFFKTGPLYGMATSTGNETDGVAPDPDNDTNSDDNGFSNQAIGEGIVSKPVTLSVGQEPTNDGDQNSNSNLSVDFGFYPLLALGDLVWYDENNDGIYQPESEHGINGVEVELYRDTDGNGIYSPDSDTYIATTTTNTHNGTDGYYRFDNLPIGDYLVVITQANFNQGEALYELVTSTGNDINGSAPGPNDDVNDDDNGDIHSQKEQGVVSLVVTLDAETEPTDDGDNNANTNLSVDFGFTDMTNSTLPAIDLEKYIRLSRVAPNQEVTFDLVITNTSSEVTLSTVVLTDTLPDGLTYVPNTSTLFEPTVQGQILVWPDISQGNGLAPGGTIEVSFNATVASEPGTYVNRANVEGIYSDGSVTDVDEVSAVVNDPTVEVSKEYVTPGIVDGRISFTITITNTGPSTLEQLPLVDHFSGPIEYVGGTPPADRIDQTGQTLGWNDLTEHFGDMEPGEVFQLETVFQLTEHTAGDEIENVVTVSGARDTLSNIANDDSDSSRLNLPVPTAIELLSFTAQRTSGSILVTWVTGAEIDTWGFHLWRSSDGTRASATRVTPELILAEGGRTQGATYTWLDTNVEAGQTYTYWLEEVELDGITVEYGPASSTLLTDDLPLPQHRVMLPLVMQ